MAMGWTLVFYQTPAGERPAAAFVEQLPEPARAAAAALLVVLRERGNLLRAPHSKPVGDGLFEVFGTRSESSTCSCRTGESCSSTGS